MRVAWVVGGGLGLLALAAECLVSCGLDSSGLGPPERAEGDAADGAPAPEDAPQDAGEERPTELPDALDAGCASGPCIVELALGMAHSCALTEDGGVACWGSNASGELGTAPPVGGGLDASSSRASPTRITLPARAVNLAGGGLPSTVPHARNGFSCALSDGATALCWGNNEFGALGRGVDGGALDALPHPIAEPVANLASIQQVAAGGDHACALLSDGAIRCWGDNAYGQLGRTTTKSFDPTPAIVDPLTGSATEVAPGGFHTCARIWDGTVTCWGFNNVGQLGRSPVLPAPARPGLVAGLSGVLRVASGYAHACAVLQGGLVLCWGINLNGELGRGTASGNESTPGLVAFPAGKRVTRVTLGVRHSCALLEDHSVWCWGNNAYGQLGLGNPDGGAMPLQQLVPARVPDVPAARDVVCGGYHCCALTDDGAVTCWGSNADGQLGRGGDAGGVDELPHPEASPAML